MILRVASLNIRNGLALDGRHAWPFRRRITTKALRALDADLIGLQEAFGFQARGIRRRLGGYGLSGQGRSARRRGERCSVLHRKEVLDLVQSETRWYGDHPHRAGSRLPDASFPRVATIATLAPSGRVDEFTFVNTHLDEHKGENRIRAAEQLLGWLPEGPVIVVGDLNAGPDSDVVGVLEQAGLRTVLGPEAGGTSHGFSGRTDGPRIDHILVSRHWAIADAHVVTDRPRGRLPSDHWPIVADLDRVA